MNGPFILLVIYQGTEHEFKARFERWGDTHRIAVLINEVTCMFEPDEQGGYRALLNPILSAPPSIDTHLLQAVAEKLSRLS